MSNTGSGMSAGSTAVTLTDSPIVNNTATLACRSVTLACRSVRRHGPRGASSDEHGNPYWRPHIASP
jgi:hypothetical protein